MRKFWGRSDGGEHDDWGRIAASSEVGRLDFTKGFATDVEEVEKGFEVGFEVPEEKGFAVEELLDGFAPKSDSPNLTSGFGGWVRGFVSVGFDFFSLATNSDILTPRKTLTLPSLRLHVFRRQLSTYSRLSWPGKSGRSPFNCRSKTIRSLQTLHFARATDGGEDGSTHVW